MLSYFKPIQTDDLSLPCRWLSFKNELFSSLVNSTILHFLAKIFVSFNLIKFFNLFLIISFLFLIYPKNILYIMIQVMFHFCIYLWFRFPYINIIIPKIGIKSIHQNIKQNIINIHLTFKKIDYCIFFLYLLYRGFLNFIYNETFIFFIYDIFIVNFILTMYWVSDIWEFFIIITNTRRDLGCYIYGL